MTLDTINSFLSKSEETLEFGLNLSNTMYQFPVDLLLQGELGTGKTTFLQGLAKGLGIDEPISSPTFALEQRYQTKFEREFLHLDLYRLSEAEAEALLRETDDHTGIRCIEWAEKVQDHRWKNPCIRIRLAEEGEGRRIEISFGDIAIPSRAEIEQWRKDVLLPPNVVAHCDGVARLCDALCKNLLERGIAVRPLALHAAAELHDLLRFLDFMPGAGPQDFVSSEQEEACWKTLRAHYGKGHEAACTRFLQEQGYPEIASIIKTHGVRLPPDMHSTIEQQLLYYADKRVAGDLIVSVDERFADFAKRYGKGSITEKGIQWLRDAKDLEQRLFPEGAPT